MYKAGSGKTQVYFLFCFNILSLLGSLRKTDQLHKDRMILIMKERLTQLWRLKSPNIYELETQESQWHNPALTQMQPSQWCHSHSQFQGPRTRGTNG